MRQPTLTITSKTRVGMVCGGIIALVLLGMPVAAGTLEVPVVPSTGQSTAPGSDDVLTLDLQGAFAMALQRNLDLQIGRYDIAAAEAGVMGSTGLFDPELSFGIDADDTESPTSSELDGADIAKSKSERFSLSLSQLLPTGTQVAVDTGFRRYESNSFWLLLNPSWSGDFAVSLTQPLLDGFGSMVSRSGIVIAHNTRKQGLYGFEINVISTLNQVETAYWNLMAAREAVTVKEQSLELARRLLNETQERVKVGTSAPIDLVQSEAGVASRQQEVIYARNAAANAEDDLKAALGFDQPAEWLAEVKTTESFEADRIQADLAEAIAAGLEHRPEIRQKLLEIEYQELQVKLARNRALPNLDFNVSYGYSGVGGTNTIRDPDTGQVIQIIPGGISDAVTQITDLDFPHWNASLNLRMPLGNHDAKAAVVQARYQLQQSKLELAALRQQIIRDIRRAVRGLEDGAAAVDAAMASSELARRNLEAEQTKFNNGLSTNYQVLEIQEDMDQALLTELQSRIDFRLAILAYRIATGTYLDSQAVRIADASEPDEPHQLWKDVEWMQFVDLNESFGGKTGEETGE